MLVLFFPFSPNICLASSGVAISSESPPGISFTLFTYSDFVLAKLLGPSHRESSRPTRT